MRSLFFVVCFVAGLSALVEQSVGQARDIDNLNGKWKVTSAYDEKNRFFNTDLNDWIWTFSENKLTHTGAPPGYHNPIDLNTRREGFRGTISFPPNRAGRPS